MFPPSCSNAIEGLESLETEKYDEETCAPWVVQLTDDEGRYSFWSLAPGRYLVIADKESESQEYDFHLPVPE